MGGKKSVLKKPLGSVGDKVLGKNNFFNTEANRFISTMAVGPAFSDNPINLKNTMRNIGEGIGEISGSNALRKEAMDKQQAAEEESKRQALISDAMARNAGGDPTSIFLSGGSKRKKAGGGGTGSAGTGSSRGTGVQS